MSRDVTGTAQPLQQEFRSIDEQHPRHTMFAGSDESLGLVVG
jgi:hypothetical protein